MRRASIGGVHGVSGRTLPTRAAGPLAARVRAPRAWRRVVALAVLVAVAAVLPAQTPTRPVVPDAEPYEEEEFPRWARDVRRAEIIAFGSLPISLLASRLLYGFGRFLFASIDAGRLDPSYLPPLFAPPGAVPLSRTDNIRIVIGAVSISAAIALIDYALGRRESRDE